MNNLRKISMTIGAAVLLAVSVTGNAAGSSSNASVSSASYRNDRVNLDFSGALVTTGGSYGGTFLAGVSLPVEHASPVRLGMDTGVIFAQGGVGLPILLSVVYNFAGSHSVRPYVGGAVGPVIGLSSGSITVGTTSVPLSGTGLGVGSGVSLAILVRPGLRFTVTQNLDILSEVALGGLTGQFYIAPTLGIAFRV